eukprot:c2114_g1_i2.p1 GENE.c2114_g1_i2~~c2114_g1_i2.p1  ORF type:complete len:447 (-),score=131.18 c2114_g1_i2:33-1187(-)
MAAILASTGAEDLSDDQIDPEFEECMLLMKIPEQTKPQLRLLDSNKKRIMIAQAKLITSGAEERRVRSFDPEPQLRALENDENQLKNSMPNFDDESLEEAPVLTIPKWKAKQIAQLRDMEKRASVAATEALIASTGAADLAEDQIDGEFEECMTLMNVPEKTKPQLRALDSSKKRLMIAQAKAMAPPPDEAPVMAIPKWKAKQIAQMKEMERQAATAATSALISSTGTGDITDEQVEQEFEECMTRMGIPEPNKPQLRALDLSKKRTMIAQAKVMLSSAPANGKPTTPATTNGKISAKPRKPGILPEKTKPPTSTPTQPQRHSLSSTSSPSVSPRTKATLTRPASTRQAPLASPHNSVSESPRGKALQRPTQTRVVNRKETGGT